MGPLRLGLEGNHFLTSSFCGANTDMLDMDHGETVVESTLYVLTDTFNDKFACFVRATMYKINPAKDFVIVNG